MSVTVSLSFWWRMFRFPNRRRTLRHGQQILNLFSWLLFGRPLLCYNYFLMVAARRQKGRVIDSFDTAEQAHISIFSFPYIFILISLRRLLAWWILTWRVCHPPFERIHCCLLVSICIELGLELVARHRVGRWVCRIRRPAIPHDHTWHLGGALVVSFPLSRSSSSLRHFIHFLFFLCLLHLSQIYPATMHFERLNKFYEL